jgi:hypothetical protein
VARRAADDALEPEAQLGSLVDVFGDRLELVAEVGLEGRP